MTARTALVLMVFGRGVRWADGRYSLTPGSAARVRAAVDYVAANQAAFTRAAAEGHPPRIVFSGGWAEASEGAAEPPVGHREGDLMLDHARAVALDRHAELYAETRSRSTLENFLRTVEDGLLDGYAFGQHRPLGIVSHAWHLPRVRYLAGKVLGLRGAALLDVPTRDAEWGTRHERVVRVASRLCFLGTRDSTALLRRERRIVASLRRAERLIRRD
jgi:uncharacterized SAM-binding protein YcdF (DUF218 family)